MKRFRYIVLILAAALMFPLSGVISRSLPGLSASSADASAPVSALFAGSAYFICAGVVVAVFISLLLFSSMRGWLTYKPVLYSALVIFLCFWFILAVCLLLTAVVSGFAGIAVYIGVPSLIAALYVPLYFRFRKKAVNKAASSSVRLSAASRGAVRYDFRLLYGGLLAALAVSLVELCLGNPTYFIMVPFSAVCLSLLLWRLSGLRFFLLCGFLAIELFVLIFCVPALKGAETAAFLRVLAFSLLYLNLILPVADLYCQRDSIV